MGQMILQQDFTEAVASGESLLKYLPKNWLQRADVLSQLGSAQGMLRNFQQSYDAYTEALALEPKSADLWYNRSLASRYTLRLGQALRDLERAIELNTNSELAKQFAKDLKFNRKMAEESVLEKSGHLLDDARRL